MDAAKALAIDLSSLQMGARSLDFGSFLRAGEAPAELRDQSTSNGHHGSAGASPAQEEIPSVMGNEPPQIRSQFNVDPVVSRLARLLAIGQVVLIGATWKLWTPQTVFPQVPLFRFACELTGSCDWACLIMLATASTTLLVVGRNGVVSLFAALGIAISLAAFFVLDQHRLQPWAWQFFLLAILLTLADDVTVRRGWQWLTISIYFWSAVSKIDVTFFHEQGPALINGLKQAIGIHQPANRWGSTFNVHTAMLLTAGEFSVAILLSFRRTRRWGVWLACFMHGALLMALGPWGLNHSLGVLLWNVFFAGQTWLAFRETSAKPTSIAVGSWGNRIAMAVILAAAIWPVLEPFGGCDHWLAWAVYSARAGQSEILVESEEDPIAGSVEYDQVVRTINEISGVFYRPNVGAWSLRELGVPIYPQFRFHVAVGLALSERQQHQAMFVTNQKRDRWNGKPFDLQVVDLRLEPQAHPFRWNTQPRWMKNQ